MDIKIVASDVAKGVFGWFFWFELFDAFDLNHPV
jgi:hypothetical protein